MITIKRAKMTDGRIEDFTLESDTTDTVDALGTLTALPALIDPLISLERARWKEDAKAALLGGITTILDLPNHRIPCNSLESLDKKREELDATLKEASLSLDCRLFIGAEQTHLEDISKAKQKIAGISLFLNADREGYSMGANGALERLFQIAGQDNLIIAVHQDPAIESGQQDRHTSLKTTAKAIELAEEYNAQLLIAQVTTREELDLIQDAKENELLVYAGVTPQHLLLSEDEAREHLPLRSMGDYLALWKGIDEGIIDMIGSGYGIINTPPIGAFLPLLLTAYHEKKLTLEQIIALTRVNTAHIFGILPSQDTVLVDLDKKGEIPRGNSKTKTPFEGKIAQGWPVRTIARGRIYSAA